MSRRMVAPGVWETEDGRTPHTGSRGFAGGPITDVKPTPKSKNKVRDDARAEARKAKEQ